MQCVSRCSVGAVSRTLAVGLCACAPTVRTLAAEPSRPAYRVFRFDEDWSPLADRSLRKLPLDDLKYILIADEPTTWLSVGGEARTRYEYSRHPGFGLRGLDHDDYVLQRFLLHADLHVGERFRAFVQGVSGTQSGAESPTSPTQDDVLDLQQAFADVALTTDADAAITLRVGRMEMGFGSYRLVTARDPTNVRLNFDGARLLARFGRASVDVFLTRPVEQKRGIFNDGENDNQSFWGVYSTLPLSTDQSLAVDMYYLGLERNEAQYGPRRATETRHSIGSRLWGRHAGWDYDVEGVAQFGTFDSQNIRAWTLASSIGYTWADASLKPRVGLKANIASGDGDPSDSRLGTVNALFPRQSYFSEASLLAPANFVDVHPSVAIKPHETVTVTTTWDPYWRYSVDDAVYGPRGVAVPAGASSGRYVGSTLDLQVDWAITPQASWTFFYAHFFAGDVVRDAGGRSVDYIGSWLTFKF